MSWNKGLYSESMSMSTRGSSIYMVEGVKGGRECQSHRSTVFFFPVDPSRNVYVLSHHGSRTNGVTPRLGPLWQVFQGQEVPRGRSRKAYWLLRPCSKEGNSRPTWIPFKDLQLARLAGAILFLVGLGCKNGSWRPWDISHAGLLPCTGFVPHPFSSAPLLKQAWPVVSLCVFNTSNHLPPLGSDLFRENNASLWWMWQTASYNLCPMRLPWAQ